MTLADRGIDAWRSQHFAESANDPNVAGPLIDRDRDGLTNLEEYAYATDPNAPNAGPLVIDVENVGADHFLRLTVTKNPAATDVSFEVQATGNLNDPLSWSSNGLVIEVDDATTLRVRDHLPSGSRAPRFMRLKITSL